MVDFIEKANALVLQQELGSKLMIILDGLEKTADSSVNAESKETACREVFLNNPQMLRLPCNIVYTIPPFMIQYSSELGALYDCELVFLPMVRVAHRDGQPDEEGIAGLRRAVDHRIPISLFENQDDLRHLIQCSGGYLRDLLRLLRECIRDLIGQTNALNLRGGLLSQRDVPQAMNLFSTALEIAKQIAYSHGESVASAGLYGLRSREEKKADDSALAQ